jgi:F-box/leucine-rich repeat protein 10/11
VFVYLQRQLDRKTYIDEGLDDDEIDGKRTFDVQEKLKSDRYNAEFVKHLNGSGK